MDIIDLEVDYFTYCKTCQHKDVPETEEPCNECLEKPTNEHSVKPVMYEEKEK